MTAAPDQISPEFIALAEECLSNREFRQELARNSRQFFVAYYLDLTVWPHTSAWLDFFDHNRGLLMGPRSHGKTWIGGLGIPLHDIIRDRNNRILFISRNFDGAQKSLLTVKSHLEKNEALREDFAYERAWHPRLVFSEMKPSKGYESDFGDQAAKAKAKGLPWSHRRLYVDRDNQNLRDPTVECVGVFGAITGGRFSRIVVDDPDDDQSVRDVRQRDRLEEWLRSSVFELAEKDTVITVIKTRKHRDDIGGRLMKDPTFRVKHDKAVIRWPGGIPAFERGEDGFERPAEPDLTKVHYVTVKDEIGREIIDKASIRCEPGAEVLCPSLWSIEDLMVKYISSGSVRFVRELQNFVTDGESGLVRRSWVERAFDRKLGFMDEDDPRVQQLGIDLIVHAWDLSLLDDRQDAEEKDSDYTVGLAWGIATQDGWKRYLLHAFRDRGLPPSAIRAQVKILAGRHPSRRYIAVESNAFGRLHIIDLNRTTDLPIVPHTTTGPKKTRPDEGIPRLATLLEGGKVVLPYGTPEAKAFVDVLTAEASEFGLVAHDDTILAWWIAECVIGIYQKHCEKLVARGRAMPHAKVDQSNTKTAQTKAQPKPALSGDDDE